MPEFEVSKGFLFYGFIVIFLILILRNIFLQQPILFADETYYSILSKYANTQTVVDFTPPLPNILYFHIYKIASLFGSNFLIISKILNSLFFSLAIFPIFATAQLFVTPRTAITIAVISLIAPINSYTAYFMPEALYFLVFWLFVYGFVYGMGRSIIIANITSGVTLAILSLIKPHGLTMFVIVFITMLLLFIGFWRELKLKQILISIIAYFLCFIITRLSINFILQGKFEITLLGAVYGYMVKNSIAPDSFSNIWTKAWFCLKGHLLCVSIFFLVPLITMTRKLFRDNYSPPNQIKKIQLKSLLTLGIVALITLLVTTAKFTADVAGSDPTQLPNRLHGRYYDFLFPLLVIGFYATGDQSNKKRDLDKSINLIIVSAAAGIAIILLKVINHYVINYTDFPEMFWFQGRGAIQYAVIFGFLISTWIYLFNKKNRLIGYSLFIIFAALSGSYFSFTAQVRDASCSPLPDKAAIAVFNLIPSEEHDSGMVIAKTADARIFRARFQFQIAGSSKIIEAPIITREMIPPEKRWLLLLDEYQLDIPIYSRIKGDGFDFVRIKPGYPFSFSPTK